MTPEPGDVVKFWDDGWYYGKFVRIITKGQHKNLWILERMGSRQRVHPKHIRPYTPKETR